MAALLLLSLIVMVASPEFCESTGPREPSSQRLGAVETMSHFIYSITIIIGNEKQITIHKILQIIIQEVRITTK